MKALNDLEGLVSSNLSVMRTLFSLIKLEARLAGLSIVPFIIAIIMLFILVVSTWEMLMLLLGFTLYYWLNSPILAVAITLVINLSILAVTTKILITNLKHLSFEKTRNFFGNYFSKETDNGIKSEIASGNSSGGEPIKDPTMGSE